MPISSPQQIQFNKKISSSSYLNELELYYSKIVNNVIDSTLNDIFESAPETYLTIHELQFIGKDQCQTSLQGFMQTLQYYLNNNKVKNDLLPSIRPLLLDHDDKESLQEFNVYLSKQLSSILDPENLSRQIIQSFYQYSKNEDNKWILLSKIWKLITDKKSIKSIHHERNESLALKAWLNSWLMNIQFILNNEFDSQINSLLL
ncbi:uncharacterized protein BX663DRAFT_552756 [Cokeromyces recurvatus]|uniref:uncharacterized protein n=1 Tax=Cokeromyces recurvatus TaxID=90255 RepID=UPI00221E9EAE|nr:uncharacterized protein BX663DRAFT_552756 [Cokeromyces recurvatus]KAI7901843.1 hypothetical protein BX663DRAFT_552756 [Cokeromyces recurvatus]